MVPPVSSEPGPTPVLVGGGVGSLGRRSGWCGRGRGSGHDRHAGSAVAAQRALRGRPPRYDLIVQLRSLQEDHQLSLAVWFACATPRECRSA
jgi:hypothetical protein